ncbi:carboxymuconolactone decarboxylase family protein [Actinokineospora sp. UTMC 2448]|uniref:carboxymuconolactone decarboxylase family protein n=1 Tax=Actinokineospora sp. UTMC 2448 TaxID=2268449 RepID=UPI0021647C5D|nr:carboxymuconolactone decarboxylase family protein [Actinokineospora sp. UTMC 2448]UVS81503.1 putative peroxidase-related enzyme [Actinokineospora sp. UTMC 2448]
MVARLVRMAVRRSLRDTRHVRVVPRRRAEGLVADVYRQVEREFGMLAPPVALHSAAPDVLAASWAILRETLIADGAADRAAKEAVATGVSEANSCPYCADVHGMTLAALPVEGDRSALTEWARATATAPGAGAPPSDPAWSPELIGVAVAFHYYNRMVNVFLRDSPFPAHVPESAKPRARQVLGGVLRASAADAARPGDSVELLPSAPLPDDLGWAGGNPVVADAFARAYAAVEAAGVRSVAPEVRALVLGRLSSWDGQAPGLSRSWVTSAVASLRPENQAAGKLALLTAMASYQVDEELVEAYRASQPGDGALIELTAWASMAAARRISSWMSGARPAAA